MMSSRAFSIPALLACILLAGPGCAWFVIGGAAAILVSMTPEEDPPPPPESRTVPSVFITAITGAVSGDVDVEFNLTDVEGNPADVQVEFSTDGTNFADATAVVGTQVEDLAATPSGEVHHFLWDSLTDVGTTPQASVYLRFTPSDVHGIGKEKEVGPFTVDNNSIPVASDVTPSAPFMENITITYTLTDPEGNPADVVVEWRAGSAGTFQPAAEGAGSDGTTGLSSSVTGTQHTFVWASEIDTTCTDVQDVEILISPSDTKQGSSSVSAPFDVSNNDPPEVDSVIYPSSGSGTITLQYRIRDSHADKARIQVEFKRMSDGLDWDSFGHAATPDTNPTTLATQNISTLVTGAVHIFPWDSDNPSDLAGEDASVTVRFRASDDGGATWGAWMETGGSTLVQNNSLPYVVTGQMLAGQSGVINIPYECHDPDGDPVSLVPEFQVLGQSVWLSATPARGTSSLYLTSGTSSGVSGVFCWDSRRDGVFSKNVTVRLVPCEDAQVGVPNYSNLMVGNGSTDVWFDAASLPGSRSHHACITVGGKIYSLGGINTPNRVDEYDPALDTWTSKAFMPGNRYSFGCAALDGKIYVAGGGTGTTVVASVYVYDPSMNFWSSCASMPSARWGLACVPFDGKIYAIGGSYGSSYLSTVEEYDPATNTWSPRASMPTGRTTLCCAALNDRIYAIGGKNMNYLSTVEAYYPRGNNWTSRASLPATFAGLSCEVLNGRIYAMGGCYHNFNNIYVNTVREYDPLRNVWTTRRPMPTARSDLACAQARGKIYAIGGYYNDGSAHRLNKVEVYDPAADVYAGRANMSMARRNPGCAVWGGKVYIVGGRNSSGPWNSVQCYDPATNAWSLKANMPTQRTGLGCAAVSGKIYAAGGREWTGTWTIHSAFEVYDIASNSWASLPNMPTARDYLDCVTLGGKVYAIGGNNSMDMEVFDPATVTWTTRAAMPARRGSLSCVVVGGKIFAIGGSGYVGTVEMYDPESDTWTAKSSMPTPRGSLGVAAVGGLIFASGGTDGSDLAVVEVYDVGRDRWATRTSLPVARFGVRSAAVGNRLFTFGGGMGGTTYSNRVDELRVLQVSGDRGWTPLPTARSGVAAVTLGDTLHVFGGRSNSSGALTENRTLPLTRDVPTPLSSPVSAQVQWDSKTALPSAVRFAGGAEYNGKAYIAGGFDNLGNALGDLYRWDPSSQTWSSLPAMSTARGGAGVLVVGGRLYVFGGDTGSAKTGALDVFNLSTETWETGSFSSMNTPRSHFGYASLEGWIFAFGGEDGSGNPLATTERYDPSADSWTNLNALPEALEGALCLYENGRLKLFGGERSNGKTSNRILVYDLGRELWEVEDQVMPYPARDLFGDTRVVGWTHRGNAQKDEFCLIGGGHDGTKYRDELFRFCTR